MKKLLNISVIAALAILPLAANAADLTAEQLAHAAPAEDDDTTVTTASYVKGAYNELGTAINTKQDKLSDAQLNAIDNVSGLNTRLGTAETDINALKTAVGNATAGLVKDVADLQANKQDKLSGTQLNAVNSGITSEKVTQYDTLVTNSANFITKDVNNLTNYTTTADMNTALDAKADTATTYTKTDVDTKLATKADAATTYTKTEVDTELAKKQNSLTTAQVAAVDSGITSTKVASYDDLVRDSANYATKAGVTATINESSVTVPALTAWGNNTPTDMVASITAATYTETSPVVEP